MGSDAGEWLREWAVNCNMESWVRAENPHLTDAQVAAVAQRRLQEGT